MSTIAEKKSLEISKEEIFLEQQLIEQQLVELQLVALLNLEREWELGNQNKEMMKMKEDSLKNREDRKPT